MNIVHLIFSFQMGGAETMLIDIMNEQCPNSKSIKLIIVNDNVSNELLDTIHPDIEVILLNRKEGSRFDFKFLAKLWWILLKQKPNVIHCHNHNLIQIIPFWKKISCITIHDVNEPLKHLSSYSKIFSISKAVVRDLENRGNLTSILVYNGILIQEYKTKEQLSRHEGFFKIIQISRLLYKKKGQDVAIKALAHILKVRPDIKAQLFLVGEGPSKEYLEKLVSEEGVDDHVFFVGGVSRHWVKENLCDYDLLIQPSYYEGFGLTIIEGLAAGLPVVASNLDGPKEILETLQTGKLSEVGNYVDLGEKLLDSYSDLSDKVLEKDKLSIFDVSTTSIEYIKQYHLIN